MSFAETNPPKNPRLVAKSLADTLCAETKFHSYNDGHDSFDQFIDNIGMEYFATTMPFLHKIPENAHLLIEEKSGVSNAWPKLKRLKEVIHDIQDSTKPIDTPALTAGFLAVRGIQELAKEKAAEKKHFVNPDEAQWLANEGKKELEGTKYTMPDTDFEYVQAESLRKYYAYKRDIVALEQLELQIETIMDTLSLQIPKRGDAGRST